MASLTRSFLMPTACTSARKVMCYGRKSCWPITRSPNKLPNNIGHPIDFIKVHREYHKWNSICLHRDMELLVFGQAGTPVVFFPTRTARFYDYENWKVIEAMRHRIERGDLQIYCVDS